MNQNLVKVNDNYGAVSDENGDISIISKENCEYELKDILIKENELEDLNLRLSTAKKILSSDKQDTIFGEITANLALGMIIVLYVLYHPTFPTGMFITTMSLLCVPKAYNLVSFYIKKRKLNTAINEFEMTIPKLEKELQDMKEKTKYKVNYSTLTQSESKTAIIDSYRKFSAYMNHNVNEEPTKVKVLNLTRKK